MSNQCGSRLLINTAAACNAAPAGNPNHHKCKPIPMTRASVPLRIANVRGAPPMRIGWVNATWSGTSKPSISSGRDIVNSPSVEQAKRQLPPSAAIEAEERHAEARGRDRDGHAQEQAKHAP